MSFLEWLKIRKKKLVIKAYAKGYLLVMSYENPTAFRRGPVKDIIGIDQIEVTWE